MFILNSALLETLSSKILTSVFYTECKWGLCSNEIAFQVPQCGPQLFSGSEDEDRDEEEDGRFNIRPQYEGPAGQKVRKKYDSNEMLLLVTLWAIDF